MLYSDEQWGSSRMANVSKTDRRTWGGGGCMVVLVLSKKLVFLFPRASALESRHIIAKKLKEIAFVTIV